MCRVRAAASQRVQCMIPTLASCDLVEMCDEATRLGQSLFFQLYPAFCSRYPCPLFLLPVPLNSCYPCPLFPLPVPLIPVIRTPYSCYPCPLLSGSQPNEQTQINHTRLPRPRLVPVRCSGAAARAATASARPSAAAAQRAWLVWCPVVRTYEGYCLVLPTAGM